MNNKKKKKPNSKGTTLYIRDLPLNVKSFFKAACIKRGITMTDKITELMKTWVQQESNIK